MPRTDTYRLELLMPVLLLYSLLLAGSQGLPGYGTTLVPPPPLPSGAPVRPRRKRMMSAGGTSVSSNGDPPPPPVPAWTGGPALPQGPARDQFGAVIPGAAPPPPNTGNRLGRPLSSGRRRGRARAAMMANYGAAAGTAVSNMQVSGQLCFVAVSLEQP